MLLTAKYVIPIATPFIEDGAVLVKDGKIADVGPADELKKRYPDEEVRDYALSALMPGFIDVHTHLGYTALRGMFEDLPYAEWKRAVLHREVFFEKEDWRDSARLGALEAVASGITTIADITSSGSSFYAAMELGLRARIYREVLTTQVDHVEQVVDDGLADIERWRGEADEERISFGIAPGAIYACHPKVFQVIARHANETGMPVAMHLAGSYEEEAFIRYGSSPFAIHTSEQDNHPLSQKFPPWLPAGTSPTRFVYNWDILEVPELLAVHCVHVDERDIEILKAKDVAVAHCPRINALLSMGTAPFADFQAAGLRMGFGTDSPAAVDTTDMLDEMRIGLMICRATTSDRRAHVTSGDILRMATIDAARALRMEDEVGSLEPGKKADIIAIDLHNSHQNPTNDPESAVVHTANQDNVKMTMVGGRVLYDNFVHVSGIDRDGIVYRARKLRDRVRTQAEDQALHDSLLNKASVDDQDRFNR